VLLKNILTTLAFIAENPMTLMTLLWITSFLAIMVAEMTPTISYALVYPVIRKRELITGNSSYNNMETPYGNKY
jgi:hypothetical protein